MAHVDRNGTLAIERSPAFRWALVAGLLVLAPTSRAAEPASVAAPAPSATKPASDAARESSVSAQGDEADDSWLEAIDLGVLLGFGARLDAPAALEVEAPVGLVVGGGLDVFFSPVFSVGLHYEHYDLGEESGERATSLVRVSRQLNDLWLGVRAYPLQNEAIGGFVAIALGAAWQQAEASGLVWPASQPALAQSFACSASDSIAVALRAQLGIDVAVAEAVRLWSAVGVDSYRLGDAALEGCAPGAGNATVLGVQTGIAYRFDPGL